MAISKSFQQTVANLGKLVKSIIIFPFKFLLFLLGHIKRFIQLILKRDNRKKSKVQPVYKLIAVDSASSNKQKLSDVEEHKSRNWKLDLNVLASSRYVGKVTIGSEKKLVFPKLSETPGVYCVTFMKSSADTTIYIGETAQLRRRFQNYRNPGPTQSTNIRLNALMKEIILSNGEVRIDVITTALSGGKQLNLSDKVARLLVEQVWLLTVRGDGFRVENA